MKELNYSIVIASKNRPDALQTAIKLVQLQTRPPEELVIVDSSDPEQQKAIELLVAQAQINSPFEIRTIKSESSLTKQRNIGVQECRSEIVVFLDDDSCPYIDAMEHIMTAYENDLRRTVLGVCSAEASKMENEPLRNKYEMSTKDKIKRKISKVRLAISENIFNFDQLQHLGNENMLYWPYNSEHRSRNEIYVPLMTGFRMSFRRSALIDEKFDENLKGYSLFEDADICIRIGAKGALVGARNAMIFHNRFPGPRENSFLYGRMQIINRAYVVAKNIQIRDNGKRPNAKHIIKFYIFVGQKLLPRALMIFDKEYREELIGMVSALSKSWRVLTKTDTIETLD